MGALTCIGDYLKAYGAELGHRVVEQFPPLHQPSDPVWPAINELKRHPFPAQALAIMGIVKRWEEARCAAAVVTLSKSLPNRPQLWFNSLRPNYGLTSTGAHGIP